MSDLQQRIVELETRLAFQEHHLQELSDALAEYRSQETQTALLLHRLREEVKQLSLAMTGSAVTGDASTEPPPPHY